jgi:glycosyltransferase involved in cell wall biosynthesis
MNILLTADPELPVPPKHYGGIERIIDMLACSLVDRGHQVTLVAHSESTTPVHRIPYSGVTSHSLGDIFANTAIITRAIARGNFDVVHSFSRLAYLTPVMPLDVPKLMTYQRSITRRSIMLSRIMSRGTLEFTAISRKMMDKVVGLGRWHLVYNGVRMDAYDFVPEISKDAPLVFLGRIEHIKGTHLAIEIAKRTNRSLVIAGNVPQDQVRYFEDQVSPYLNDPLITYIGPVDDQQKNALLGGASALLMPILWEEPFGIVMAEALACGTPILGLARGSVPEIVEHCVTGFVCDDVDGLVKAVDCLPEINRSNCRSRAEAMFSDRAVVDGYLSVYREMMATRMKRNGISSGLLPQ